MKTKTTLRSLALLVTVTFTCQAQAATVTKAAAGTDLTDGANWGGAAPTAADTAAWSGTSLGAGLTLGGAAAWQGITVTGAASNIDITGAGPLTLGTGGIDLSGATVNASVATPITLDGAQIWKAAVGRSLTVSGAVSGSGGLTVGNPALTTATFLTNTAQPLFANADLSTIGSAAGWMGGAFVNSGSPIQALGYQLSAVGATRTFWLKVAEGGYTKAVKVELAQAGTDITARAIAAKYISGTNLAFDFETGGNNQTIATSQTAGGYGANSITLFQGANTSGTVTLSGPNTFAGGVTVNSGRVVLSNDVGFDNGNARPVGTGDLTVNPTTTVANGAAHSIWGGWNTTRAVTVNSGSIDISAGQEYFHTLNMTGGVVGRGASTFLFRVGQQTGAGSITTYPYNAPASITTALDMTLNSLTLNVADGTAVNDLVLSGVISQNTGAGTGAKGITKTGAGTVLLSNANTYTGTVAVNGGTLKIGNKNALGPFQTGRPVTQVVVADGATVDFNGVADAIYGYTIAGAGVGGLGALVNNGGAIGTGTAQTTNLKLAADAAIGGTGNWALLGAGYSATGLDLNGRTLTKLGSNTFTMVNATATAGNLVVAGGTLATYNGGTGACSAPNASLTLNNTSGVSLSLGANLTVGSLAGGGAAGGHIALGGNTLTVGALGTDTGYDGVISGTGNLVKTGSGVLTLTGASTYTGTTTLNGGTLVLAGTTATTGVTVNATATLNSGGAINGPVTVTAGGTLTPAGAGIGTLQTGNAALGGTFVCQIDKTGGVRTADVLTSTGTLTYGGTLEITATGETPGMGDSFKLFDAAAYEGAFAAKNLPALPAGLFWDLSGLTTNGTISVSSNAPVPDFSPGSGGYVGATVVTVSSGEGTTIRYTIDGSDPLSSGTTVTAASPATVTVPTDTATFTINAYATVAGGGGASATSSATYSTVTTPRWTADDNGSWTETAKWLNAVSPNVIGAAVDFFTTAQSSDTTITLDASRTVGSLTFGNPQPIHWTLAAANGSTLNLATAAGTPAITVLERTATVTAPITGTQGLVKDGAGSLIVTGANTISGGTEVRGGTLIGTHNTAFSTGLITLGTTAEPVALYLANRADVGNPIEVSATGTGTVTIGADNTGSGSNAATFLGMMTLNRPVTFSGEVAADRLALDGRLTGPVGTLTVAGGSRVTLLSTLNDFTGDIVVTGTGTILQASVGTAAETIPNGSSVTVAAGAFLQLASTGGAETIAGLNGEGTVRTFPTATYGAVLAVGSGDANGNFTGKLINGNGPLSLTKIGTGTQMLGGFNTYTGNTVVNAGTLALADDAALTFLVTNTATNTLTGAGTVTLDGNFAINVAAVTATTGTWLLENADTLTGPYGATFQCVAPDGTPWTDAGSDKWTRVEGTRLFTFQETTGTLTVSLAGYLAWADANAPGQSPGMDHDSDGVPNGVEYFMGLTGNAFTANPGPDAGRKIVWPKGASYGGTYGTDYVVQTSTDLGSWTDVPAGQVTDGASLEYTIPNDGPARFARLKVTGP